MYAYTLCARAFFLIKKRLKRERRLGKLQPSVKIIHVVKVFLFVAKRNYMHLFHKDRWSRTKKPPNICIRRMGFW